jgi:hypothetical protein
MVVTKSNAAVKKLFAAYRKKGFSSELVCPPVEEGKRSREVRCLIGDQEWYLFAKELHRGIGGWVLGSGAMQHIN